MRAAVLREGRMIVRNDLPEPEPASGQVVIEVEACGICGSDLHFAKHGATMVELLELMRGAPTTGSAPVDLHRDVFMGHEFCGRVVEAGSGTQAPPPGTLVTSIPILLGRTGVHDLAYSNDFPSGYGERMLLSSALIQVVPNGLDAKRAALTEPMAVGLHAVNRSGISTGEGAVVLGCGPIGIAVIAALSHRGVEPIVASDYSPMRRALAATMGAHQAVDPEECDVFDAWAEHGRSRPLVVFEAVGTPGMIDGALRAAPRLTRLVVVGVCMGEDRLTPFWGIAKELAVQFVLAYDLEEFATSLRTIADGEIDVTPMITGEVGIDGVAEAFDELGHPDRHCKVLVTSGSASA